MVHTHADTPQLRALVVERRRLRQVAAALLGLLGALLEQDAEVSVRGGVPRICRDRRAVGRLRAVEVLSLVLQQDAEVEVRVGVPRIRCDRRPGFLFFALILCEEYLSTFADLVLT